MTKVEVITSVQRRRRWSNVEKEEIVAAAIAPGALLPRSRVRRGSPAPRSVARHAHLASKPLDICA